MSIADVKNSAEQKMNKSIESLKTDLAKVRTGRAHTGILDHVEVDYYGSPTKISQVANITLLDAAYHFRSALGKENGQCDRKGDSRFRSWPESFNNGRNHSCSYASVD